MIRTKFGTSLLVVLCAFASLAAAQTPSATLVGRITDASHAGIAGATVQVRSVSTNELRTTQSQADGEYTISNLQPGGYEVTIDKAGFKQLRESNLTLQVDQIARVDAQLQIGAVMQTVDVKADVPLMNTENFSRGDVITSSELTRNAAERAGF